MVRRNGSRQENNSLSNLSIISKNNIILAKAQVLLKLVMIHKILYISCPSLDFACLNLQTELFTQLSYRFKANSELRKEKKQLDLT